MPEIKDISKFHIFSAAYAASTVDPVKGGGEALPEIAFIGRSNVGKSSLINSLTGQRKLAYVSREPGKTRTINYYAIQSRRVAEGEEERQLWYLVDLPGYGFAKTSQQNKDTWSRFIARYVEGSPRLSLMGLLIDLRHPGLPIDQKAYEWLRPLVKNLVVIGTKADKLGKNEIRKNLALVNKLFPADHPAIAYSALDGTGRADLLSLVESRLC